jgi:hypothetical protein
MFSGRRLQFSGTRRASFASCVRSNLPHSQVGRRMFSRAYIYGPRVCYRESTTAHTASQMPNGGAGRGSPPHRAIGPRSTIYYAAPVTMMPNLKEDRTQSEPIRCIIASLLSLILHHSGNVITSSGSYN